MKTAALSKRNRKAPASQPAAARRCLGTCVTTELRYNRPQGGSAERRCQAVTRRKHSNRFSWPLRPFPIRSKSVKTSASTKTESPNFCAASCPARRRGSAFASSAGARQILPICLTTGAMSMCCAARHWVPWLPRPTTWRANRRYFCVFGRSFSRAPRAFLFSDDESIVGAPFFVMERRHGIVVRSSIPRDYEGKARRAGADEPGADRSAGRPPRGRLRGSRPGGPGASGRVHQPSGRGLVAALAGGQT